MFRFQMTQHPEMQAMLSDPLGPEQRGPADMATSTNVQANPDFQRGLLNPYKLARTEKLESLGETIRRATPNVGRPGLVAGNYGESAWGTAISHFGGRNAPAEASLGPRSRPQYAGREPPTGFNFRR